MAKQKPDTTRKHVRSRQAERATQMNALDQLTYGKKTFSITSKPYVMRIIQRFK